MHVNCWQRVEAPSSVFLYYMSVVSSVSKEGKMRGGSRLVVVSSSEPQLVSCCQSAASLLCTGSCSLAATGLTDLDRTEHRAASVSDRDSDSSRLLAVWSLTFPRNIMLPFTNVKGTDKMTSQKN